MMKRRSMLPFCIMMVLGSAGQVSAETMGDMAGLPEYEQVPTRAVSAKRPLTILVYMAADNDLQPFVASDIRQMERVGSTNNVNVLVYLNTRYQRKVTRKLIIGKGKSMQFGPDEARDSGDPETLINALEWAHEYFPSDQFMLIIWNHGNGALNRMLGITHRCVDTAACTREALVVGSQDDRIVCFDDTTKNYFTDAKLQHALEYSVRHHRKGKKFDIVAFDACLMASIEIAFVLHPYANYMVASQETVPGNGYGYHYMLERPAREVLSSRDLAIAVVQAYEREYGRKVDNYTLSAVELFKMPELERKIDELSKALTAKLSGSQGHIVRHALDQVAASRKMSRFHEGNYVDLSSWCTEMYAQLSQPSLASPFAPVSRMLEEIRAGITRYTIANTHGSAHPRVAGTSIYFPSKKGIDFTYPGLIWSQHNSWFRLLQLYKGR